MQDHFDTAFETGQSSRDFNLKEFIFKYLRYWPLLSAFVLIALTIAFIRVRYTTPIYRVSGSLFINKEGENRSSGESLESMFLFSNNLNLQNELEILKSKPLVSRVVKALGLQVSYFNKGNVRSSNIYGASPVQLDIVSLKDSSSTFTIEIEASEKGFHFPNTNANIEYGKLFETRAGIFRINKTSGMSFAHYSSDNFLITYQPLPKAAASLASAVSTAQTIDQATILHLSKETDNITLG